VITKHQITWLIKQILYSIGRIYANGYHYDPQSHLRYDSWLKLIGALLYSIYYELDYHLYSINDL